MATYRVDGKAEEFDCPRCGQPWYNGESAYHSDHDDRCYCCRGCAMAAQDDEEQNRYEQARKLGWVK